VFNRCFDFGERAHGWGNSAPPRAGKAAGGEVADYFAFVGLFGAFLSKFCCWFF